MRGYHSPTPWKVEPMSPAFAQIVDAEGGVVVAKMFKDDAAFIVRAVSAYTRGTGDFSDTMDYLRFVRNPAICGLDLSKKEEEA